MVKRRVNIHNSNFLDTHAPITTYEKVKFVILLPIVLLRLITFFLILLIGAAYGHVVDWGRKAGTPLSPTRRAIFW